MALSAAWMLRRLASKASALTLVSSSALLLPVVTGDPADFGIGMIARRALAVGNELADPNGVVSAVCGSAGVSPERLWVGHSLATPLSSIASRAGRSASATTQHTAAVRTTTTARIRTTPVQPAANTVDSTPVLVPTAPRTRRMSRWDLCVNREPRQEGGRVGVSERRQQVVVVDAAVPAGAQRLFADPGDAVEHVGVSPRVPHVPVFGCRGRIPRLGGRGVGAWAGWCSRRIGGLPSGVGVRFLPMLVDRRRVGWRRQSFRPFARSIPLPWGPAG